MRCLAALLLLAACCQATIVFPDQFESMKESESNQRFQIPAYRQPALQSINDVESAPYGPVSNGGSSGGFVEGYPGGQQLPPPQNTLQAPQAPQQTPQRASLPGPSATPLDAILPSRWRDHVLNIISRGVTKFTLDMDRAIESSSGSRENLLFSPVSLTVTLAMVLLASGGRTFEEVARILGLESGVDISHHSEIVHRIFGLMIQESDKHQPGAPQCKFAFGMFVEEGYPVREQFRAISEKVYKSEIMNVDFARRSRDAQATINNWVNNKTEGKIQQLLNEPPNPLTEVIITSALYFSGEWAQHFMDGSTKRRPFNVEPNETIYIDLMFNGGFFPFYEDKELGVKILGLPYKGSQVTMYALLPTVEGGTAALKDLKNRLTPEAIDRLIGNMKSSTCLIGFPKMKLSSTLKLQSALEALGLGSLFNPHSADLSLLTPGRTSQPQQPQANGHGPISTGSGTAGYNGGFRNPVKTLRSDYMHFGGGERSNFHRYNDNSRGYRVEQWNNGYNINYVNNRRARRQSRPIDQEFVNFLNSQNLPSFGIDDLRNSAGLHNPGLYADEVIHKVEMTVNEKGTEAAAATGVILDRSGDYKRFIANRPFLFFIRDDSAKVIWFWGSINRPTPFYTSP